MLNLLTNEAIYWVKSASQIPYYESSAPLRPILHWWMSANGSQLLHAAAVGLHDKGVLIIGKGGSGKSNTAISCLESDLYYAADDYCLLSFNPEPEVHSLYATGKLFFEDVKSYNFLKDINLTLQDKSGDKALFFLYPKFEKRLFKSFPIKAILLPKISNKEEVRISLTSAAKAYLALAPSTIFQLQGCRNKTHENIARLLHNVPCFSMDLSINRRKNTDAIFQFLNSTLLNS